MSSCPLKRVSRAAICCCRLSAVRLGQADADAGSFRNGVLRPPGRFFLEPVTQDVMVVQQLVNGPLDLLF